MCVYLSLEGECKQYNLKRELSEQFGIGCPLDLQSRKGQTQELVVGE